MSYVLYQFDGVRLPFKNPTNPVGVLPRKSKVQDIQGRPFDPDGSQRLAAGVTTIKKQALITGDSPAQFRANVNIWRALVGQRGQLVRRWGDGTREWVLARLLEMDGERKPGDILCQQYDFSFQILSPCWYDETQTVLTPTVSASPTTVTLTNAGTERVTNPVIQLTVPGSKSLSSVRFVVAGVSDFTYTGALNAANVLRIDCGAQSVTKDGANAYANFSRNSGHAIEEWLRLEPGTTSLQITVTPSGQLPVSGWQISFYGGWS